MDEFAPYLKKNGTFTVRNITPDRKKTIKIFNYPILYNTTRDLLQIPGVAEADIRASLLKGELRHKILAKDIVIEASDIDLLQFNIDQKLFLQNAGVVDGLSVAQAQLGEPWLSDQHFIGIQNSINTIFYTATKFLARPNDGATVFFNGMRMNIGNDYLISESGGPGTGYDTIIFINPPVVSDILRIDYRKA
jgi:hypothetical protein